MTLSELKVGENAKVIALKNADNIKARLKSMGLGVGTAITVINVAPLKSPIAIKCGNLRLAICRAEADKITVEYV